MTAASLPQLLTVEEFDRIPNPPGGVYELRHGEAFFVGYPDIVHKKLQRRLRELIQSLADNAGVRGVAETEFPYRPLPEHELWAADMAFVSEARFNAIPRWLLGSPEIVIEVKSPSNSKQELLDKAMTALAGGAHEFWIVDAGTRSVTVHGRTSGTSVYKGNQSVPVALLNGEIDLRQLFAGLE